MLDSIKLLQTSGYPANEIFLICLGAASLIRLPYAALYHKRAQHKSPLSQGLDSLILLFVVFGMFAAPLIYLFSDLIDFANYQLCIWSQVLGTMVFLPGLWLLWRSHSDLGANWSPTVERYAEHTLITEGVYTRIRHPMYTAHFLWGAAQCLLLGNWIAGPSLLVSFTALYLNRVGKEEALMHELFGKQYGEYTSRSGRLLPKF